MYGVVVLALFPILIIADALASIKASYYDSCRLLACCPPYLCVTFNVRTMYQYMTYNGPSPIGEELECNKILHLSNNTTHPSISFLHSHSPINLIPTFPLTHQSHLKIPTHPSISSQN